jgi:prephenate dehydrogenase
MLNIAVVGIGLIGGSMALDLKKNKRVKKIVGVDKNPEHLGMALQLGLIHEAMSLEDAIKHCNVIILSTPVDVSDGLLPKILSMVDKHIVFDVGSTKENIVKSVENHPKRSRFIATHPMAGTEYSGPEAAVYYLFRNKTVIFCDIENSDDDVVKLAMDLYEFLGMNIVQMDTKSHDLHAAYVSHISHISSFALALTVLEKEKYEKNILTMASGGFDSTVRLAKSSPDMWTPILFQNSKNVVEVIDSYVNILLDFKNSIETKDSAKIKELILKSNAIRKVLDKYQQKVELGNML